MRIRGVGTGRRHRQIGDQDVIGRESHVDFSEATETSDKQPGTHQQEKRQGNLSNDQRVAQRPGLVPDCPAFRLIQNRAQIGHAHVSSWCDSKEHPRTDRQDRCKQEYVQIDVDVGSGWQGAAGNAQ